MDNQGINPQLLQQLLSARLNSLPGILSNLQPEAQAGQEDYSPNAQSGNVDIPHLPIKGNPQMINTNVPTTAIANNGQGMNPAIKKAIQSRLQIQSSGPLSDQEIRALQGYSAAKNAGQI